MNYYACTLEFYSFGHTLWKNRKSRLIFSVVRDTLTIILSYFGLDNPNLNIIVALLRLSVSCYDFLLVMRQRYIQARGG